MNYKDNRLFAHGCSFTQYSWPTWADILGKEFGYYENWGNAAAGNQYMFNSVIECLLRNPPKPNDVYIIMWTNILREDKYINHEWIFNGNITTPCDPNFYDKNYIKKYVDARGFAIRDYALIEATHRVLKSYNIKHIFLSMVDMDNTREYENIKSHENDVLDLYKNTLSFIRPSVHKVIFNYDWNSIPFTIPKDKVLKVHKDDPGMYRYDVDGGGRYDLHPTPAEHLMYIEKVIPEFSNISADTRAWVNKVETKIRSAEYWIEDFDPGISAEISGHRNRIHKERL